MKNILFVIYSMGYGGAERSLLNLLQELPENRYHIDVLVFRPEGDFIQQLPKWVNLLDTPTAVKGLCAPVQNAGKYAFAKIMGTAVSKLVRKGKKAQAAYRWHHCYKYKIKKLPGHYDTAVAYVGGEVMYYVHDFVDADRKLVWIHNDYRTAGYSKEDDAPYFVDMDAIVSVSKECVSVLKEEFPEHEKKIHYIENITSSTVVKKQAELFVPQEYHNDTCNILTVGRLMPQKGYDLAIDAAAILRARGLDFHWYALGAGVLKEKLEKQIATCHVEDCFHLVGTRNNPYPYIKNCTVMVQSSRYEGKSVVLDEAKILGARIVVTAYPTAQDQIVDEKEGIITEMTPEGIAGGICEMLENQLLQEEIRDYLQAHEYGNQAEVSKYIDLLG